MSGFGKLNKLFISNNNVLLLIFTASLVIVLDRKRTANRYVNYLASSTLAIYLITDSPFLRKPLDTWLFHEMLDGAGGFALVLLVSFACLAVDKLREALFAGFRWLIDRKRGGEAKA